ncbi:MAG: hypothetical protein HC906_16655 [Bacteroidales bacterium]|nr:hypothetical protein [Bacteroidales bacterium]
MKGTIISQDNGKYLIVGQGGGITGKVQQYKITCNGEVLKGSGLIEINYSQSSDIGKKKAKKYFKRIKAVQTTPFKHPGNMYYFIEFFDEGEETKYTWGSNDFSTPEELKSLYKEIWGKISALEYKAIKN